MPPKEHEEDDVVMENCAICNESFPQEDLVENDYGDMVCEKCEETYVQCHECSEYIKKGNAIFSDAEDDYYCSDCYHENYVECCACNDEVARDDSYTNENGDYYCQDCYHDRYTQCHNCGEEVYRDDACYSEDEDEYYCSSCYDGGSTIKDYGYCPSKFINHSMPFEVKNKLYMGIELEVETKENYGNQAKALQKYLDSKGNGETFYFKWDGSVDGFEIVSHPYTLRYAHQKLGFYDLLKWLQKNKFTSFKSGRCGLHIHLSRRFFSANDIRKMRLFFAQNFAEIEKLSCRHGKNMSYCRYKKYDTKDLIRDTEPDGDRYSALNFDSGKSTLEIRIFRGTLHHPRFLASIQFADAVSHFVKEVGCAGLTKNSWSTFLDWCKMKNRYCHLLRYIENKKILEGRKRTKENWDPEEGKVRFPNTDQSPTMVVREA